METKEKETELVQLVRQLRDYVTILYKYRGVYKMMEASEFIRLAEQDKSTTLDRIGDIIGTGYTPNIDPDKEEHNLPETEKYFQRWTKSNN